MKQALVMLLTGVALILLRSWGKQFPSVVRLWELPNPRLDGWNGYEDGRTEGRSCVS